jgi:hypothetical protein
LIDEEDLMMHPDIEAAINQIDAALFGGDTFIDEKNNAELNGHLGRWARGLAEAREIAAEVADEA